jgi:hypothetical protein
VAVADRVTDHLCAEGQRDCLVAQAHTKDRDLGPDFASDFDHASALLGPSRARSEHYSVRCNPQDLPGGCLITSDDVNPGAKHGERLHEVVRE